MIKRVLTVVPLVAPLLGCGAEPGDHVEPLDTAASEPASPEAAVGTTQLALSAVSGNTPVVVALYETDSSLPLNHGRNPNWWRSRVFGDATTPRNIASYIQANAKGKYSILPATASTFPNPPQDPVRLLSDTRWRGNDIVFDFTSIPPGGSQTLSKTLNGTQAQDAILLRAKQPELEAGLRIITFVSPAANVATLTIKNTSSAAIDPGPRHYGAYSRALDQRAGITTNDYISADGERWTRMERRRIVQMLVESGFDFRPFDRIPAGQTKGDGMIRPDELTILGFTTSEEGGGLVRNLIGDECITVGTGLKWCGRMPLTGYRSTLMQTAHELTHVVVNTLDLYGFHCNSQDLTLMSCTALPDLDPGLENDRTTLLDPWHRQQLGWLRAPRVTTLSCAAGQTCQTRLSLVSSPLAPPAGSTEAHRFDSETGSNDGLILEYRSSSALGYIYDDSVPQAGVVPWVLRYNFDSGEPEGVRTIPYPDPPPSKEQLDPTLFTVAPESCIGNPMSVNSRGRGGSMQFGQSYRMRWVDGTDTGYLFTIGSPAADNTVVVSYRQTAQVPQCSINNPEYTVQSVIEPVLPFLTYRGGVLDFSDTTVNSGSKPGQSVSRTSYYLSKDQTFSPDDVFILDRPVPPLSPGGSSTVPILKATIPNNVQPGDQYIIACADSGNTIPETVETDNCIASANSWLVVF